MEHGPIFEMVGNGTRTWLETDDFHTKNVLEQLYRSCAQITLIQIRKRAMLKSLFGIKAKEFILGIMVSWEMQLPHGIVNPWNWWGAKPCYFSFGGDDGRYALILDCTIFHPQGGGQPSDHGHIISCNSDAKFLVEDVRSKDGIVFHYGSVENMDGDSLLKFEKGMEVLLYVDESRRNLNSRLHSAGHLLDICIRNVGLGHLEPGKGYHFPDGPFVEYKGTVQQTELQNKQKELEEEVNALISRGGEVSVALLAYEEASNICGGSLPDYIPKGSTPRIVRLGSNPGCPCGGTHVHDISDIKSMKVTQMRMKKGMTKVFYTIA